MSSDLSLATASRRELRNLLMTMLLFKAPAWARHVNLEGQKVQERPGDVNMLPRSGHAQRECISSWSWRMIWW